MRCGKWPTPATAVLALALSSATDAGQSAPSRPEPVAISSRIVTSAVIATWGARYDDSVGPAKLEFLVLWRGTPGWVWPGPFGTTTKGTPRPIGPDGDLESDVVGQQIAVGKIAFDVTVDRFARVARIRDRRIPLREANVILVDQVDGAEGLRIARTMWVDPRLAAPDRFQIVIQRSPELRAFVRCDVHFQDPVKEQVGRLLCSGTLGK